MVIFDTNPLPLAYHHSLYHGASSPTIDTTEFTKKIPTRSRRRVMFSKDLCSYMELTPKTRDEKKRLHYGRKECRMFQQDRVQVCMFYEKQYHLGQPWAETDHVSIRGLEDFFAEYSKENVRRSHTQKVLIEQTRQQRQGECCADTLRFVACESSGHARVKAHRMGELDELFVQQRMI